MEINTLAGQILGRIFGPAMGGTWSTNAETALRATGCTDWALLEDTLIAMINDGLIRVYKWQTMPNGQVIQTYIPATEIEAEIFDEHGFSIEPLPAAQGIFEKQSALAASQEA